MNAMFESLINYLKLHPVFCLMLVSMGGGLIFTFGRFSQRLKTVEESLKGVKIDT